MWVLALDLALLTLVVGGDSFTLSPAQMASSAHSFDLVGWHLANSMSKWTHRAFRAIPGLALSDADRLTLVDMYFELGDIENELKDLMDAVASRGSPTGSEMSRLQSSLERAHNLRHRIRNDVEEALESEISSVVRAEGMGLAGEIVFPPVDIRLMETPKALITSRRDRIERRGAVLLDPHVSVAEREAVEALLESVNLSALVVDIGGVATFPASVYNGADLRGTLFIMAHEWLHHYLAPRPLGWNMFDSPDMQVLNETVADLAGRELGDMAYERIEARTPATVPAGLGATADPLNSEPTRGFDFRREMQKTRRSYGRAAGRGRGGDGRSLHGVAAQIVRGERPPDSQAEPGVFRLPWRIRGERGFGESHRRAGETAEGIVAGLGDVHGAGVGGVELRGVSGGSEGGGGWRAIRMISGGVYLICRM